MCFGCVVAQLLAFAAVAGVFGAVPDSERVALLVHGRGYLLWLAVDRMHSTRRIKPWLMVTIVLTGVAVVGVFVEIPIVSKYAFWIMAAAYVIMVASTDVVRAGD